MHALNNIELQAFPPERTVPIDGKYIEEGVECAVDALNTLHAAAQSVIPKVFHQLALSE
jgi:hypothetical protein